LTCPAVSSRSTDSGQVVNESSTHPSSWTHQLSIILSVQVCYRTRKVVRLEKCVRFIGLLMTVIYIYCVNCMKFGQLILRKVMKIVATRCHILRLKMHQIRLRLGLRPRPRWGSLRCSPRPPS